MLAPLADDFGGARRCRACIFVCTATIVTNSDFMSELQDLAHKVASKYARIGGSLSNLCQLRAQKSGVNVHSLRQTLRSDFSKTALRRASRTATACCRCVMNLSWSVFLKPWPLSVLLFLRSARLKSSGPSMDWAKVGWLPLARGLSWTSSYCVKTG